VEEEERERGERGKGGEAVVRGRQQRREEAERGKEVPVSVVQGGGEEVAREEGRRSGRDSSPLDQKAQASEGEYSMNRHMNLESSPVGACRVLRRWWI
jgi:hypothetical protein